MYKSDKSTKKIKYRENKSQKYRVENNGVLKYKRYRMMGKEYKEKGETAYWIKENRNEGPHPDKHK